MQPRQSAGNQSLNLRRNLALAQIDKLGPECVGDNTIKSRLIDKAAIDHGLGNGLSVQVCFLENVVRLRRLQDALFNKKLDDLSRVHD